jgi:hypothetical protein
MARKKICIINPIEADLLSQGHNLSCRNHRHMSPNDFTQYTASGKDRPWLKEANHNPIARWATLANGKESTRYLVWEQDREWRQINTAMQWVPRGGKGKTTGNRYKIKLKDRNTIQCKSEVNGKTFREWKRELADDAKNTDDPEIISKAPSEVWRHLWVTGAPPSFNPA